MVKEQGKLLSVRFVMELEKVTLSIYLTFRRLNLRFWLWFLKPALENTLGKITYETFK